MGRFANIFENVVTSDVNSEKCEWTFITWNDRIRNSYKHMKSKYGSGLFSKISGKLDEKREASGKGNRGGSKGLGDRVQQIGRGRSRLLC